MGAKETCESHVRCLRTPQLGFSQPVEDRTSCARLHYLVRVPSTPASLGFLVLLAWVQGRATPLAHKPEVRPLPVWASDTASVSKSLPGPASFSCGRKYPLGVSTSSPTSPAVHEVLRAVAGPSVRKPESWHPQGRPCTCHRQRSPLRAGVLEALLGSCLPS